ncbi:L-rhamnose isomerase [Shigella boydii]
MFGIGAESYTVGSNEFSPGVRHQPPDRAVPSAGHFHPTEVISDTFRRHAVCAAVAAARQPSGSLGQRSRSSVDHQTRAIASEIVVTIGLTG